MKPIIGLIISACFVSAVLGDHACGATIGEEHEFGNDKFKLYPFTVLLEYVSAKGKPNLGCGGSLINNQYVLTAASCIRETTFPKLESVRLGAWDAEHLKECDPLLAVVQCADLVKSVKISKVFVHEDYKTVGHSSHNDIALIKLAEPVEFGDHILPICLPKADEHDLVGQKFEISEWYRIPKKTENTKLIQEVTVETHDTCDTEFHFKDKPEQALTAKHICATGSCGLGGLPLMKKIDSVYHIEGIVSLGGVPCRKLSDIYTRVSSYVDWINNIIEA